MVFAVLTFVWSGLSFIVFGLLSIPVDEPMQWAPWISLLTMAGSAGKIVGAAFMIVMKKWGFWMYTACEGALLVLWFATIPMMRDHFLSLGMDNYDDKAQQYLEIARAWPTFPVLFSFFSIAWIIVYGTQLKKMK